MSLVPASASTSESARQLHSENFKSRPNQRDAKKHNGCSFHPGRVGRDRVRLPPRPLSLLLTALLQLWSCCGGYPMSQPCRQENNHVELVYSKGELEANWWFEHTPCRSRGSSPALVAVAVDCEMGTAESGESELIRVSMIDYFTGSVLVDSLVWPDVPMAHFNTRFSGVTRQAMNEARRRRACLFGRHGARRAIWNHVGPETVVIGHSLNSDLTSLRWIHHRVVDTLMVEDPFARADRERLEKLEAAHAAVVLESKENKQPVPPAPKGQHPGCSLKSLTKAYLKRDIQLRGRGHDSLEDATATRDLLHWHIVNRMPTPKAPDAQDGW